MTIANRPRPVADDLTTPFWDAVKGGQLLIQLCRECAHYNYPPSDSCTFCSSERLEFRQVSGRGTIFSYTITRRPFVRGFREPYTLVLVELAEQDGLLLLSEWAGTSELPIIGEPVYFYTQDLDKGVAIPMFRRLEDPTSR